MTDPEVYEFRLYIAGHSPKSVRALENLRTVCQQHLAGHYRIEVVDLTEDPGRAKADDIVAIPTLVRRLPEPVRKVIGDLSELESLIVGLQIRLVTG